MTYSYYKRIIEGCEMPLALVDLDVFDENIRQILERAAAKTIRIATKSVRCTAMLRRLLEADENIRGLMCYTAREALWLSELGFDDLLVAYPTFHPEQIRDVARANKGGAKIYLMADMAEHLEQINRIAAQEEAVIPICMDLDMSTRFPGIYFGVYRSRLRGLEDVVGFVNEVKKCPNVRLAGVMGYEAQIAGVGDNVKGRRMMNALIRMLKRRSIGEISERRRAAVAYIEEAGFSLDFVNGGGTGSLETTREEDAVTEVTVGSGFYTSTLFDSYVHFRHLPAVIYGVEIVRKPKAGVYTCLGGGYVASGSIGKDKAPKPHLPLGASLIKEEMAGEVQTPVVYDGKEQLKLGDPIFFRHSKAGELFEHFKEALLVSKGKIVGKAPTYRGEGKVFL